MLSKYTNINWKLLEVLRKMRFQLKWLFSLLCECPLSSCLVSDIIHCVCRWEWAKMRATSIYKICNVYQWITSKKCSTPQKHTSIDNFIQFSCPFQWKTIQLKTIDFNWFDVVTLMGGIESRTNEQQQSPQNEFISMEYGTKLKQIYRIHQ